MDKKFASQIILLLVVTFSALAYATGKFPGLDFLSLSKPSIMKDLKIDNTVIKVEVADDSAKRKVGLGGRDSLATDTGMLFVFDSPVKPQFWMKNVKFPLDIIWIKNMTVVDIIRNAAVPAPDVADDALPRYVPNQEVDMVLEVNAGFVDSKGIKNGDTIN